MTLLISRLMLAAVFGLLGAAPAFAQDAQAATSGFDSRWSPYLGCWRVASEQLSQQTVPVASGLMVCVRPSGRTGVAITTTVDGKSVLEQTIVADGSVQPVSQSDCEGTQTSEWSRDGERLFTRVELQCTGRPKRLVSGITQMAKGQWVDAQATVIDGNSDVRLRRYRRTSDPDNTPVAVHDGATLAVSAPMTIEDVLEASRKVLSPALEAALVEAGGKFEMNSRTLRQLADAGVSPNVIDLMVAQAYPDRFQVERPSAYPSSLSTGSTYPGSSTTIFMGSGGYPYPGYDPFFNSYYYYSPFAYPYYWGSSYYPYRYSLGYGYPSYYYNNYYYGGYPGSIYYGSPGGGGGSDRIAQPGSPDSRGGDGVVVNGRGYTRVRPAGSSGDNGNSGSTAGERTVPVGGVRGVSRGSDSSGGSVSSGGYSSGGSSSSSGSSGSSSGSSGGGSSDGGGRTAQPR